MGLVPHGPRSEHGEGRLLPLGLGRVLKPESPEETEVEG